MISIILTLWRLMRPNAVICVRRMPRIKTLRAHLLGLSCGLLLTWLSFPLTLPPGGGWPMFLLLGVVFLAGTLWGGPFVIIAALLALFGNPDAGWLGMTVAMARFYLGGYLGGAIFALFYNDLVYLHQLLFFSAEQKIILAFDPKRRLNVIKSPLEKEELALLEELKPLWYYLRRIEEGDDAATHIKTLEALLRKAYAAMSDAERKAFRRQFPDPAGDFDANLALLREKLSAPDPSEGIGLAARLEPAAEQQLNLKARKAYHFRIPYRDKPIPEEDDAPPARIPDLYPYTIALIANPRILRPGGDPARDSDYEDDPIIRDRELFLQAVEQALASFESNEVLGRPEIWSRVRILTVFDERLAGQAGSQYGMVRPYPAIAELDGEVVENLLDPLDSMDENAAAIIRNAANGSGFTPGEYEKLIRETDVVFALSAAPRYDRSTARYSDWQVQDPTVEPEDPDRNRDGVAFTYDPDPDGDKGDDIASDPPQPPEPIVSRYIAMHEYYRVIPGRVALNVLGASPKTYIHEFAHAMSAAFRGAIVDEYFDRYEIEGEGPDRVSIPFYANRIDRKNKPDEVIPVHKKFAEYNGVRYHSEEDHGSAAEDWLGYFPERKTLAAPCTMDRSGAAYRFDALVSRFMYDRLLGKLNRNG